MIMHMTIIAAVAFLALSMAAIIYALLVVACRKAEAEEERDEALAKYDRAQEEIRALDDKLIRLECQNGLTPGVEP